MNKFLIILTSTVMLFIFSDQAKAVVIYSTLGAGNPSYDISSGWTIGYTNGYIQGDAFTPSATYTLSDIELAVGNVNGTNGMNLQLMSDNSGQPGSVIESYSLSNFGPFGSNNPLVSVNSVLDPVLLSGTQYWLIASAPDSTTWDAWNQNNISIIAPHTYSLDGGATWIDYNATQGAFLVDGNPYSGHANATPEPATMGLMAAGLAGLFFRRRLV